jgi:hypothetical protein
MGMKSKTNALTLFGLQLFPVVAEDSREANHGPSMRIPEQRKPYLGKDHLQFRWSRAR